MSTLKKVLIAILFIASIRASAQSDFAEGYIILNNNDTVGGFLKQEVESNLLTRLVFKTNKNEKLPEEYSPGEIKAFSFYGGNSFESIYFKDADAFPVVYFAKELLKGYYDLYSFRKNDLQYYIIKHQDSAYLLYDDILLSSGIYDTKGNYRNLLLFLSRDCSKLTNQISGIRYSESDIIDFTQKINTCIEPNKTSSVIHVKPKSKTSFYVYAGGLPLGDKYQLTGRALARIYTPSISRNVSLNAGVNYLSHKTIQETPGKKENYVTNIYSATLTVQNNFTTGIIQPYVEAGMGVAYKQETNPFYQSSGSGFQSKYGFDFVLALGVEGYITKQLAIKADWRYELVMHYPVIGIAYFF